MMSFDASRPATLIVDEVDADALPRNCMGFHPSSEIFLIACAANLGVERLIKMSTLAALICTTWESTVGDVIS
jgi:hypothetical protein